MATTHQPQSAPVPLSPPRPPRGRSLAWKKHGLAALSGLLLVGAFPHLDWGWLAWIALVPFFLNFPYARLRDALKDVVLFGFIYFGGLLYWLVIFARHAIGLPLAIVGWLIAVTAQVLLVIVFAVAAHGLSRIPNRWAWILGVPAAWTLLEWVRQLGILGTGWGDLAYTQHLALSILQVTKLAGVWGLTFLIVLVNVALAGLVSPTPPKWGAGWALACLLAAGGLLYGFAALRAEHLQPTFVAAALQGNIDENVPWQGDRPQDPAYVARVMSTYAALSRQAAEQGARLVVWPETMFPGYLRTDWQLRDAIAAEAVRYHQAMLIGANEFDPRVGKDANALILVNAQGKIAGSYEKQQLVPFGEFVPFRKWLTFLEALHLTVYDRKRGGPNQPLLDAGAPVGRIGAALCYESSYGWLTRGQVARGAGLLVISTDDTWFGRTAAARQHAAIAAIRAAEADRYVIRCAATGISQVIAPTGRVVAEASLFQRAVVATPVQSRAALTPYVRWGDWFVALCAALLAGCALLSVRGRAGTSRS